MINDLFAERILTGGNIITINADQPRAEAIAVNQKTDSGADYVPEEKITAAEAIRVYTLHSAYGGFEENIKGSLEAGKLADLAILGADPKVFDPVEIAHIPVQGTIIDGEVLYEKDLR